MGSSLSKSHLPRNYWSEETGQVTTFTERMRIAANGNVGIGSAPSNRLHVHGADGAGSDSPVLRFSNATGTLGFFGNGPSLIGTAPAQSLALRAEGVLVFGVSGNSERMRLNSDGAQVSAVVPFFTTVGTNLNAFQGLTITAGSSTVASFLSHPNSGELKITAGYGGWGGYQTFYTNGAEAMRIDSSGNVLINAGVAPAYGSKLKVGGGIEQYGNQFNFQGGGTSEIVNRSALGIDLYPTGAVLGLRITAAGVLLDGGLLELGYKGIPRTGAYNYASRGKMVVLTANLTINNGDFAGGDAVSFVNQGGGAVTLIQGAGLTMRLAGTTSTGNRTLANHATATVWFDNAGVCYISGAGVS